MQDWFYISKPKYNERGLNGSDVIVTLVDSELDLDNCIFKDINYPTLYNITNLNHRKVFHYDTFSDKTDKVMMHGTHCGGIIAKSNRLIFNES